MTGTTTIAALRRERACYLDTRVGAWERHYGRTLAEDEFLPLAELAEIKWGCPPTLPLVEDLLWTLRCCEGGGEIAVEVACRAAYRARVAARGASRAPEGAALARGAVIRATDAERAAVAASWATDPWGAVVCSLSATRAAAAAVSWAAASAKAPGGAPTITAERATQRVDLLELLLGGIR